MSNQILFYSSLIAVAVAVTIIAANQSSIIFAEITQKQELGINEFIQNIVNNCSELQNDACIVSMTVMDELCKVAYFEACFDSDKWNPFMERLKEQYKENGEDSFVTLNNEHWGNDSMLKNN